MTMLRISSTVPLGRRYLALTRRKQHSLNERMSCFLYICLHPRMTMLRLSSTGPTGNTVLALTKTKRINILWVKGCLAFYIFAFIPK